MHERSVFLAALDIADPICREEFLVGACAGDPVIRQSVEELLANSQAAANFLDTPAAALDPTALDRDALAPSELGFLTPGEQPGSLGRLGNYEVLRLLGRGGMGIVLVARDTRLDRLVALKVLAPHLAAVRSARDRFLREAKAAAAVRDEHVVTILAIEEEHDLPYLVLEMVEGMSLAQWLQSQGPLSLAEIVRIGSQVARGLAAAHAHGLVHRDVKPANILLEKSSTRVKLTDFGLARVVDDMGLTQSGLIVGTPSFMSPEQARGEAVDYRADLFSLGCVLYAMAAGQSPFQAETTIGILRRVCDDAPRPLEETWPEVPAWLAALIGQLLAKDPANRPASAAKVAELLTQPADCGLRIADCKSSKPGSPQPAIRGPQSTILSHPWSLAAALLLCATAVLAISEFAGVTHFMPAVIRVVTGEGTLVVEVNDPAVKVTVEGDGNLVISGAGIPEFRLPPGSYRVRAEKDGKLLPLNKEVVTISRGGHEVVKVRFEGQVVVADAPAPNVEKQAFAVLRSDGTEVGKFDRLAEAILRASDGDTIEIRGNGPFITPPIHTGFALTIRAASRFKPLIRLDPTTTERDVTLLNATAPLVLEGLELHHHGHEAGPCVNVVASTAAPIHAANCRFVMSSDGFGCRGSESPLIDLRNCEFIAANTAVGWWTLPTKGRLNVANCVATGTCLSLQGGVPAPEQLSIRLMRNTFVSRANLIVVGLDPRYKETDAKNGAETRPVQMEASENILETANTLFSVWRPVLGFRAEKALSAAEAEALIGRLVGWRENDNHYSAIGQYLVLANADFETGETHGRGLEWNQRLQWDRFWSQQATGARDGRVKFRGGNILARSAAAYEQLSAEDFRLRPDSAGYRAGKDGKDLGADIDLVGPGEAYERWKQTPEYQTWLKET